MAEAHDPADGVLPRADTRRLSNQIARVYRGTFGARTGLQTIVRMIARQALSTGASPGDIARAFELQVLSHAAHLAAEGRGDGAADLQSQSLIELTQQCVADVAREILVDRSGVEPFRPSTP